MERWRPIKGWPYEVSDLGRVRRSVEGGSPIAKAGRLLRPGVSNGYLWVRLCDKGRLRDVKVHHLVCDAFVGPRPSPQHQMRHLNGLRADNRPGNLVWGTAAENGLDRRKHETQPRGEHSPNALFTQFQVDTIRHIYNVELGLRRARGFRRVTRGFLTNLAKTCGVKVSAIQQIMRRGYGYPWDKAA